MCVIGAAIRHQARGSNSIWRVRVRHTVTMVGATARKDAPAARGCKHSLSEDGDGDRRVKRDLLANHLKQACQI